MSQYPYPPNPYVPPTTDHLPGSGWTPRNPERHDRGDPATCDGAADVPLRDVPGGEYIELGGDRCHFAISKKWRRVAGHSGARSDGRVSGDHDCDPGRGDACRRATSGSEPLCIPASQKFDRRFDGDRGGNGPAGGVSYHRGITRARIGSVGDLLSRDSRLLHRDPGQPASGSAHDSQPRAVAAMQQAWYYWMQQQQYGEGYGYGQQGDAGESAYPPAPPAGSPDQQNLPPPPSA